MGRKPFDMQSALAGKPVVTRDAQPAFIVHRSITNMRKHYPLLVISGKFEELCYWVGKDGRISSKDEERNEDLFMLSEKTTLYIAVYVEKFNDSFHTSSHAFKSKKDLEAAFMNEIAAGTVKIIEIEIED